MHIKLPLSRKLPALLLLSLVPVILAPARADDLFDEGTDALLKKDYARAIDCFTKHLAQEGQTPSSLHSRGHAYFASNNFDKAVEDYDACIRLDPTYAVAFHERAVAYQSRREYAKAIGDYTRCIQLNADAETYASRGTAHRCQGDYSKAVDDYRHAMRLDPKCHYAFQFFADLLATCADSKWRDGDRAVGYAWEACELTDWKDPFTLDTLAAAYAEQGNFREAVKWEKKALDFSDSPSKILFTESTREEFRSNLKLFEAGKTLHDEQPAPLKGYGLGWLDVSQQTPPKDAMAHLSVIVSEDAELWFNGSKTTQTGAQREFVSPELSPGKKYSYEIKVRWMLDGTMVEEVRTVHVQANTWQTIDFTKPQPPGSGRNE